MVLVYEESSRDCLTAHGIQLGVCKFFIIRVCLAVFHAVVFAYLENLCLTMQAPSLVLLICKRLPVSNCWGKQLDFKIIY